MAISSCSSTNESINVLVSQGCDKHRVSICIDNTVGHLKEQLYEVTGIPIEGQKLIFKGRNLQNDEETISSSGIKEGSKLMMIGRKVDPAHDEYMKSLEGIDNQIKAMQRKLHTVELDIEEMEKGFLSHDLMTDNCKKREKQCLSVNENLMQLLEKLDAVVPASGDAQVRRRRKSLVTDIEKLLTMTDSLSARIKCLLN